MYFAAVCLLYDCITERSFVRNKVIVILYFTHIYSEYSILYQSERNSIYLMWYMYIF